jgi:RimJ/RimL family protein N-acetyltransferase
MENQHTSQSAEGDAKVVTLCGSTTFEAEFAEVNQRLTMEGCVVISLGMFSLPDRAGYDWTADRSDLKALLGRVHFQKIRMADEVYIVDPGGYLGESTRREIAYAESLGKPVRYLSRECAVRLRRVEDQDLEVFFEHQADPQAIEIAAFPARDHDQFAAHWARLRADDTKFVRTILVDELVAGNIGSWRDNGQQLLGYWVGREYWGRGVATKALALLVDEVSTRPLYAHVAVNNVGSMRVLEKCGFRRDLALEAEMPAPDDGIAEFIFVLDA